MTQTSKKILFFILILVSISGVIFFYYKRKIVILNENGKITIAKKIDVLSGGSRMSQSVYSYWYSEKEYRYKITDGGKGKLYIYMSFLPSNPNTSAWIDKEAVPECILEKYIVGTYWDSIPICK